MLLALAIARKESLSPMPIASHSSEVMLWSNTVSIAQSYEFKSSLTSSRSSFSKTSKPSRSARSEVRRSSCESCHASGAIAKDVRQLSRCTASSRAWRSRSRSSGVKSANFIFRIGLRFGEKVVARDYTHTRGLGASLPDFQSYTLHRGRVLQNFPQKN